MKQLFDIDLKKIPNSSQNEELERKKLRIIFKNWFT